ncbi:unnamed protein product [Closterium sp. Yama58-4]|nr:unnamed protein product [Closterium sp. Yama58-4]
MARSSVAVRAAQRLVPSAAAALSATFLSPAALAAPLVGSVSPVALSPPSILSPAEEGYSVETSSVVGPRGGAQLVQLDHLTGDDEGIAVVTLNRPAARNAISKQLLADLLEAMAEVRGDGGVEGAGKAEGAMAGAQ